MVDTSPDAFASGGFAHPTLGAASMIATKPIAVAGAGSIGCFVGGVLSDAGRRVSLLARHRVIEEINGIGLRITSVEGFDARIAPKRLLLSDDPSIFNDAGVVL